MALESPPLSNFPGTQKETSHVTSPDLDGPEGEQRAIQTAEQAWGIYQRLVKNNKDRDQTNVEVQRQYNGRRPFNQAALTGNNQGWRSNFSSRSLAGVVDKCVPTPIGLLSAATYVTASKLPPDIDGATEKSIKFRDRITKTIRGWDEWETFEYSLWMETILHGAAMVAFTDPHSPWPTVFKLNEAQIPEFSGQHAKTVQVFTCKKDILIHEFARFLKDREAASNAGWDVPKAVDALSKALPRPLSDDALTNDQRKYEEAMKQGSFGNSMSGSKVVKMAFVFGVESTGKVSFYGLNRDGEHEALISKFDIADSMEEMLTLFTLNPGDGTFYSSMGLGKTIVNACISLERNRNRMIDQLRLAGLMVIRTDASKSPTIQMKVVHPFILAAADGEMEQTQVQANVTSFVDTDNQLLRWIEQSAGAYISDLLGADGNPTTATEEQIRDKHQSQQRTAFLARAAMQHAKLVSNWQKRLCDPGTSDKIAKKIQKDLEEIDHLTKGEIKMLAESSTPEFVQGTVDARNQKLLTAYAMFKDDPDFDQYKLKNNVSTAAVDPEFTREVLLDQANLQSNVIEAMRLQLIENEMFLLGGSVPAAPRDMHEVHLKTLFSEMRNGIPLVMQGVTQAMDAMNVGLQHAEGHLELWAELGAKPAQMKPYVDALKGFREMLQKQLEEMQKAKTEEETPPIDGVAGHPDQPGSAIAQSGGPTEIAPGVGEPIGPPQPPPQEPKHFEKMLGSIDYKNAPPTIRRQMEKMAGFEPATNEEDQAWSAQQAIEAHPDLPNKVGKQGPRPVPPSMGPPEADPLLTGQPL